MGSRGADRQTDTRRPRGACPPKGSGSSHASSLPEPPQPFAGGAAETALRQPAERLCANPSSLAVLQPAEPVVRKPTSRPPANQPSPDCRAICKPSQPGHTAPALLMATLDWAGSAAGVVGGLASQGVSWRLLVPDGYEGDHAELATSSRDSEPSLRKLLDSGPTKDLRSRSNTRPPIQTHHKPSAPGGFCKPPASALSKDAPRPSARPQQTIRFPPKRGLLMTHEPEPHQGCQPRCPCQFSSPSRASRLDWQPTEPSGQSGA